MTGTISTQDKLAAVQLKLTSDEIVEEFLASSAIGKAQLPGFGKDGIAISFMGEGEPGRNAGPIMEAVAKLYKMGAITHASISTIGRPEFFKEFSSAYEKAKDICDFPPPSISVSIHSPIDSQRAQLSHYPKNTPPSMEDIFSHLINDYLDPHDPTKTLTPALRFTLLQFANGQTNYSNESLQKLLTLRDLIKQKYGRDLWIVIATLNESDASRKSNLSSPQWGAAVEVQTRLGEMGVAANLFGDDTNGQQNSRCTCGLLAYEDENIEH